MANEGSTKPTYSELEAENLRVRGLLQRQYVLADESVWRNAFFSALAYSGPSPKDGAHRRGDKIFRRMMELQWEIEHGPLADPGAESADIGKLDSAEESGRANYELLKALSRYVIDQKEYGNPATLKDLREYRSWKNMPQDTKFDEALLEEINGPGSAETGGEKAAQQKYDAVFLKIVRLLAEVHDAFESPAEMSKWGGRRIVQWQQQVKEVVGDARLLFDILPCEALPSLEQISPQKRRTLDLPEGFLGQRCGQCGALFPDSNFKFCSECGAHLVYAVEAK